MISHTHRCIFIHIPRTGGTSVEVWLTGIDWSLDLLYEKHMIASQAKRHYAQWWDSYFKFSIVRDPYTRVPSQLKYRDHWGLTTSGGLPCLGWTPAHYPPPVLAQLGITSSLDSLLSGEYEIDFTGYHRHFGDDIVLESDYRYTPRESLLSPKHKPGMVYGNFLDEELDFVARTERLGEDMAYVRDRLGTPAPFGEHREASGIVNRSLGPATREHIAQMYREDMDNYGYAVIGA